MDDTIQNSILDGINKRLEPYGIAVTTFLKEHKDRSEHKLIDKDSLTYLATIKLFHDIIWYNGCQYFNMESFANRIKSDCSKRRFSPKTYDPDWDDNIRTATRIEEELKTCGFEPDGYNKSVSKSALGETYATVMGNMLYVGNTTNRHIKMYEESDTDYVKCEGIKQCVASLYVAEMAKLSLKLSSMDDLERIADVKISETKGEGNVIEENVLEQTERLLKDALAAIRKGRNEPMPEDEPVETFEEPQVEPKKKRRSWNLFRKK